MSPEMNRVMLEAYVGGKANAHMFTVGALRAQGYIKRVTPGAGGSGRAMRTWAVKREHLTPMGQRYCEERLRTAQGVAMKQKRGAKR